MDPDSAKVLKKVVIDLLCLFVVGFPILLFYLFGQPYKRGFFCDDESIKYPYKDSTVSNTILYIVGLILPICFMIAVEILRWRRESVGIPINIFGHRIPVWISNSYKAIGVFGFGAACSQLLTDIGKYSIGRLRPHFLYVCDPKIDCSAPEYKHRYIEDFICMGNNAKLIRDSRLSFPSGHSSFSAYTMIYLVIYLQCRFNWKGSHLIRHVIQFCCVAMAWGTALSRVSNYKHHWSDVTVGLLLGIIVAVINAVFVSDLLKKQKKHHFEERNDLTSTSEALASKGDGPEVTL